MSNLAEKPHLLEKLRDIMRRLRDPDHGCPWDLKQDYQSIIPHTLEEVYEVIEAIDNKDWPSLKDELGDLLLQIAFYTQFAEEDGYFTFEEVIQNVNDKMIRRHPHIFGDVKAETPEEVLKEWHKVKAQEKANQKEPPQTVLGDIQSSLPALMRAHKAADRLRKMMPQIKNESPLLMDKLNEEVQEIEAELTADSIDNEALELEIGDALMVLSDIAAYHGISPERALSKAISKLDKRFTYLKQCADKEDKSLSAYSSEQLDVWWQDAKKA